MTIHLKNFYLPLRSCQFVHNCPRRKRRTRLQTLKTEGHATLSFQLCLELMAVRHHVWLAGDLNKPVNCSNSKENSFKRKRTNATEMKRTDESSCDAYVRSHRWGYSSPAFHCRSPPAQLYKLKNSTRLESNPTDHCDVPGMTVQQAILFRRTLAPSFLETIKNAYRRVGNTTTHRSV